MQYRHLEMGEIIQAGDEIDRCRDAWRDDAVWEPVHPDNYGEPAPDPKYPSHRQYRRPISEQALGRIERAIKGQEKHPDEAGFGQDVCLDCGWDKGGEIPEELVKRSETGEALCPECNEVCHYFDYREEHLEHKKACSELHMAVSPFGVDYDTDDMKFFVYEKTSRKKQGKFDDSKAAFAKCELLNTAYAAMKRGQQKAEGPSKQWVESMAKVEDECPSVSVGGMASDLGLFCHCGMEMDKHDAGCGHSAIAIEEPGEPFVFTDYECVKCGVGFYLPSGVCDHCNQKHPMIDHYESKRRVQSFNVGDTLRMPNYDTAGGFRVWSVEGVHLGAEGIESVYRLQALDVKPNALANDTYVPCIMLETHPEVEKV